MKEQVREKILLLCEVLDKTIEVYEKYQQTLADERKVLVSHVPESYQEVVTKKEMITQELLVLEKRRNDLLEQISDIEGNKSGKLNSQGLLDMLQGEEKRVLALKLGRLKSLVLEVKDQNEQVELLLGKMVHFISNLFARLKGCFKTQEFYTPGATKQMLEMPGLLISEMV